MNLFQVDAFTETAFSGNPAGVCLAQEGATEAWMLAVAREMNLSETAFLRPEGSGYRLRWFTPKTEVSLCGHATLASAHVLWEEGHAPRGEPIEFYTKSGTLVARGYADIIELDFPARSIEPAPASDVLNHALNLAPSFTGKYAGPNGDTYLLEVATDAEVRQVVPDAQRLLATPARVIIVTSRSSDPSFDFVSRFFAPRIGILEDPVTGSAHCYLAPYWGKILEKTELVAYQASERGGVIRCALKNDRVALGGKAKTIFRAELLA